MDLCGVGDFDEEGGGANGTVGNEDEADASQGIPGLIGSVGQVKDGDSD